MLAIWLAIPLALQFAILACLGSAAGALANCIIFACSNSVRLKNPWAPADDEPPRRKIDVVPVIGWVLNRAKLGRDGAWFWLGPCVLEVAAGIALPLVYWCQLNQGGFFPLVITSWISIPLAVRYVLLSAVGLAGGVLANYLIYTQCHFPRPIDPWAPADSQAPPRRWSDRLPVIGWFGLRREASLHGKGFWVRPLVLELAMAVTLPLLYLYQTQQGGLFPPGAMAPHLEPYLTQIFFGHAILMVLMVAATFIDLDEQTIPDLITIPGTVIALILGALTIEGFMPTLLPVGKIPMGFDQTTFDSPWYLGKPWMGRQGLWAGLGIWSVWCFALAERRFSGALMRRRGVVRAIEFFFAALFHHWTWKLLVVLWATGLVGILVVWEVGGLHWKGLYSALVGLAVGGGTIWAIRIVASWAMRREAMGFGDVTLMAMIGAFLGWQAAVLSFGFSPFTAIAIVLIQYIITRNPYVPFGPYLCAGAALTVIFWDRLYNAWLALNLVLMWPVLQWLGPVMLGLMAVLLFLMRIVKSLFLADDEPDPEGAS